MSCNCHYYVDNDGTNPAKDFICGLDSSDQAEFFVRLDRLVNRKGDRTDVETFGQLLVITWSDIYVYLYQPTDNEIVVLYGTRTTLLSLQRAVLTAQRFLESDRMNYTRSFENA